MADVCEVETPYLGTCDPETENWGAVTILYNGLEGRVCYDGWDDRDASVACREMGFQHGQAYNHNSLHNNKRARTHLFWSSNFQCR